MGVARVRENTLFVGLVKDATMTREYELVNASGLWVTAAGLTPEVWSRLYHQNGFKTKKSSQRYTAIVVGPANLQMRLCVEVGRPTGTEHDPGHFNNTGNRYLSL